MSESLWANGVALGGYDCGDATYGMSVIGVGTTAIASWDATVTVVSPDGSVAGSGWLSNYSPSSTLYLCAGIDAAGTYTVTASWSARDTAWQLVDQGTDTTTFTLSVAPEPSKVRQKLKVHRYRWGSHGWRITGKLTRAGHPRAHVKVYIDAIVGGYGIDLYSKRTNRRGLVTWHATPKTGAGRIKLALYVYEDDTSTDAWSRTFRLPHRG